MPFFANAIELIRLALSKEGIQIIFLCAIIYFPFLCMQYICAEYNAKIFREIAYKWNLT